MNISIIEYGMLKNIVYNYIIYDIVICNNVIHTIY